MQLRTSTCGELKHSIPLASFQTQRDGHPRTYDLDLVVAVVNCLPEIVAVLRAADTVRDMLSSGGPDGSDQDLAVYQDLDAALAAFERSAE
jgi:hypothetical protein